MSGELDTGFTEMMRGRVIESDGARFVVEASAHSSGRAGAAAFKVAGYMTQDVADRRDGIADCVERLDGVADRAVRRGIFRKSLAS
jgi:hypothetical protein